MSRSTFSACVATTALLSLSGCNQNQKVPLSAAHTPEILIQNRAKAAENASTPWVNGATLNFPAALDAQTARYWVIFVDQTPCAPGPDSTNPLAYEGSPGRRPSCKINIDPPNGNRDRHFRYALWTADLGPLPGYAQVYSRAQCSPVCP